MRPIDAETAAEIIEILDEERQFGIRSDSEIDAMIGAVESATADEEHVEIVVVIL